MLSTPNGSPWALALPCLAGQPKPISVLMVMKDGCSVSAFATSIAAPMASISVPSSTVIVWKPNAYMRSSTFSRNAMSVLPSMEMRLES